MVVAMHARSTSGGTVFSHTSQYSAPTEKQYAAIGCAVVEWANVELLLGTMLTRLLSTPEFLGRIYTSSMSAVRLQEAISEAAEIHAHRYRYRLIASGLVQEIREVNGRVTTLRALRNKLAHFYWMRLSDDELFGTSPREACTRRKRNDANTRH
jgi:hypothetical protein